MDLSRQSLLAEALGRLGRFEESAPIRQQMFERSLAVFDLQRWLEHLPEAAHADARSRARQLALGTKTRLRPSRCCWRSVTPKLRRAGCSPSKLTSTATTTRSSFPSRKPCERMRCWRGETVVYRALLRGVLDRANARAYGHAARYWTRLREIADSCAGMMP